MTACAAEHCLATHLEEIYVGPYDTSLNYCKGHAEALWKQYTQELRVKLGLPTIQKNEEAEKKVKPQAEKAKKVEKKVTIASALDPLLKEGKYTIEQISDKLGQTLGVVKDYASNIKARIYYLVDKKKWVLEKREDKILKATPKES